MGTRGGPRPGSGRKSKAEEAGLNELIDSVWPEEKKRKFFESLVRRAMNGNMFAAKLLLEHRYGKPRQRVELGGANGQPIPITVIEAVRPNEA